MLIKGGVRHSRLATCLAAVPGFFLAEHEAIAQLTAIAEHWSKGCDEVELCSTDRAFFAGRQFLNPYCVEGLTATHRAFGHSFSNAREQITGRSSG
ncbi:hypothetical protein P8631_11800 [Guyparkeria sp. 1SP6A2]|nr:hypothetical protein [Guyparkeria sp. 1SP6A2]